MRTSLLILLFCLVPLAAMAQETTYLVGIPNVTNGGQASMADYIEALYLVAISIAALLAVVKIIIAGAKYMLSDVVTNKQEAIKDIRGALLGLLIVLAAVLILETINRQLTELDALEGIEKVTNEGSPNTGPAQWQPEPGTMVSCDGNCAAAQSICSNLRYSTVVCYDNGDGATPCGNPRAAKILCKDQSPPN